MRTTTGMKVIVTEEWTSSRFSTSCDATRRNKDRTRSSSTTRMMTRMRVLISIGTCTFMAEAEVVAHAPKIIRPNPLDRCSGRLGQRRRDASGARSHAPTKRLLVSIAIGDK